MQNQPTPRHMTRDGKPIPTGERIQPVKLLIQLSGAVADRVLALALDNGETPSQFVERMLSERHGIGAGEERA